MKATFSLISKTMPALFAIAVLLVSAPAKGDIILSFEPVTDAPGSTGTFDVLLTNSGPSSQNIAGFNFELTTANTDITFTDVTTATTTATYIFSDSLFGPDITTIASGQTAEAADVDATGNGTNVGAGATFGLGSVSFSISPGATNAETAQIDFSPFPATSLSDMNSLNVGFTAESGTITVASAVAVPEPVGSGFQEFALAIAALLLFRGRIRRTLKPSLRG
jgi:hypothetical protein